MFKRPVAATAALFAAAGLVVGACGGGGNDAGGDGAEADGATTLAVSAKEFAFDPKKLTARTEFTISFKNTGTAPHDFSVEEVGVVAAAEAGKSATAEAHLEPGTYTFFCSVPGHRAAGMEGTITVT